MKLSVWETETIIKILTPAYCPITKASNNSHFHSSHFFALYFPNQYQWFFLSLLPFLILEIKNNCVQIHYTTRTEPRVVRSTLFCGIRTWMGDQKRIPRVVITSFFFIPFRRRYLRLQNSPALCDVASFYFSAICSSFRHVRIRVYIYNVVQSFKYTTRPVVRILLNSLDFWSSKTVTSILLLSVVLLKPIHAMTFRTKFLLVCFDLRPPK